MVNARATRRRVVLLAAAALVLTGCATEISEPDNPSLVPAAPAVFGLQGSAAVVEGSAGGAETSHDGQTFWWITSTTAEIAITNDTTKTRVSRFRATFDNCTNPVEGAPAIGKQLPNCAEFDRQACTNTLAATLTLGKRVFPFTVSTQPVTISFDTLVPARGRVTARLVLSGQPCHVPLDGRDLYVAVRGMDAGFAK